MLNGIDREVAKHSEITDQMTFSEFEFLTATVSTDKADYTVGETVTITGTGWEPGETVELVLQEEPIIHEDIVYLEVADADGNFTNTEYSPELHDLGASYTLTATGLSSGMVAVTTFTDAPPAANLDQVRNGSADSPVDPGAWVNGNLGSQQSHYAEGMSAPYRVVMTDMPPATVVTLTLEYDVKHSGRHALDYLTHYDRIEPHNLAFTHVAEEIDPTDGVAGFSEPADDTHPIPPPPVLNSPVAGQPTASFNTVSGAGQAFMSMWNGDITNISYPNTADLSLAQSGQQIDVTFTTGGSMGDPAQTLILAWGGHIGSRLDWGFDAGVPRSAGGISGSPYHMRTIDWNLNNLGNQDRSLSAGAVVPPPECTLEGPESVCEGTENVYTLTPIGAINPSYTWELVNNTTGAFFVGGVPGSDATMATVDAGTGSGGYTVKVTINSEFGTSTCELSVIVNAAPVCSISGDDLVCPSSTSHDYSGPDGMDSYSWSISGNGTIVGATNGQSVTVDAGSACGQDFVLTLTIAKDGCESTCMKTVSVDDDTDPVIACPADVTFNCTLGDAGSASATDNCDPSPAISSSDVTNLDACGLGTIIRTWTATDACGNSSTCVQTITIKDDTPPVITCPGDKVFDCVEGDGGTATATDNCTDAVDIQISSSDVSNLDACGLGTITRTWTATDCAGNSSTCVQTITIKDDTPPVITCPGDKVFDCVEGDGGTATATDNCTDAIAIQISSSDVSNLDACGLGTITRTWTATDCAGNSSTCVQTITIKDDTPPVITCPGDKVFDCVEGDGGTATATDNCTDAVDIQISSSDVSNLDACGLGTITRTWTATDCAGNSSTCVQTITIKDDTPPVITCPGDKVFDCVEGDGGTATATDNCTDAVDIQISSSDVSNLDACGLGTITRTWTATDCAGNSSTCVQTITIKDDTPPVITCPGDKVFDCVEGDGGTATATDNCTDAVDIQISSSDVSNLDACGLGTITRTWTATDCAGNSSTCVQTITIKDDTPPVITCPGDKVFDCVEGDGGTATATDNCTDAVDIQISSSDVSNLDACGLGTITRTWTATDCAGNSSTCVQTITIKDDTPPTISCPANETFDCTLGDAGSATASDNCTEDLDIQISSSDVSNLDECGLGTITRTWTATDCAGNSSTCVQTITIKDDTPPTISCPANATFDCTLGDAGSATASDNCTEDLDIQISSSDVSNVDECGLGTITRTWTATDCAGNSSTCTCKCNLRLYTGRCRKRNCFR